MSIKTLESISWQVSEDVYRADPSLSYSTIAKYERTGFNELDHLFDRIETPSLTFGSAVDSIITGGMKEFEERFIVAEFPALSDSLVLVARTLFSRYGEKYSNLLDIPDEILAEVGAECSFYANDKYKNYRVKLIKENCVPYYKLLFLAKKQTIIDQATYQDVMGAVNALKSSEATEWYFRSPSPFDDGKIERAYQLKFKAILNGVPYRCMADLLIVDHDAKIVQPVDLKTSSKPEWDFYKSFLEWRYDIQARLYWRIIRKCMDEDPYFKDFKLADYQFIVVNRRTLTPLVWGFPLTQNVGELTFGKIKQTTLRDPEVIGEELHNYLERRPRVPKGVNCQGVNDLCNWFDNL